MTKTTSKKKACCRTLALIPLFLAAIGLFSTKIIAQNNVKSVVSSKRVLSQDRKLDSLLSDTTFSTRYKEYNQIIEKYIVKKDEKKLFNLSSISEEDLSKLKKLFLSMSPEQQNTLDYTFRRMETPVERIPTKEEYESWKSSTDYGVWLDGKRIENSELDRYKPSDFGLFYVSKLARNAKKYGKHVYQLDLYTTKQYEELKNKEKEDKSLYLWPNFKRA